MKSVTISALLITTLSALNDNTVRAAPLELQQIASQQQQRILDESVRASIQQATASFTLP